ncbi:hypothetical protein B0J12DRAFT_784354 [Macrophomina phaseolina]|uniref:Uncharacterized protein n=1 Tax=Macrophomina phaseolina TaxID=35725 RepID=A0ABQ8GF55_9PEZI|nr:hypothetical protein B0J12DRAFT_784354 [Macrophomina phaseolina]
MTDKVSRTTTLTDLRRSVGDSSSPSFQDSRNDYHSQHQHQREDLSEVQVETVQLELSRHILKQVYKVIKSDHKGDASWLYKDFIRPSVEFGCPITVTSNTFNYAKIENIWETAVKADPTIMDEGALVLSATKNGFPVRGLDLSRYAVRPAAVQANIVDSAGNASTPQQPRARVNMRESAPVPSPKPIQASMSPPITPSAIPMPTESVYWSNSAITLPGDVKIPPSSPRPISPTSTLRSNSTSPRSPRGMKRAPPYSGPSYHAGGYRSDSSASQQSTRANTAPNRDFPVQKASHSKTTSPDPGTQMNDRQQRFSRASTCSTVATTVTFQANIATDGNISAIPFCFDDIPEAIDDIMAFVDWKNSNAGCSTLVNFSTFMSIVRFRPAQSNALVLCKED